ncbi:peptide ABC transporter substrate-binding protein [Thermococcus profundus]|uniref:Peptide ABC transporter substrate-binding protein n=1 Tax=Thermococcus profundus TaxID=49899 RepID=A0A2Z2MKF6_THEPR|nr:ABC transporter substrate-binding protein [Thermococcus profundus]ASJ02448.1 peptide ABC transporter substrate-binding protein [Thermococcus profundus]
MKKTKIAVLVVFLVVFSVVASGCIGGGGSNTTSSSQSTTQSQGTSSSGQSQTTSSSSAGVAEQLVIGVTDKVTDLDPANAYDFYTWEVLNNVMEGLVKYKPGTLEIEPGLAEKWEVNNDSTVWTFHLRKGLKFDDGSPFTAQDVVRSINRIMTIKGDPSWLVTSFVDHVEAKDDYTVVFYLKHPTAYFLALLTTPPYFPVSPKYDNDKIDSDATFGGIGPYKITKWVRDQELVLEANPNYYGDQPKTKKIIIRFYNDASTMRLALQNGEIDIAWRTLRPTDIKSLKKNSKVSVIEVPGAFIRYVCLNTKIDPTKEVKVRQALAAAINRQEISNVVFQGTVEPLYSLIPNGMWSHKDVFKDAYGDANLDKAKQLLQEAGYSKDNPLKITLWYTPTHYGDTEASLAQVLKSEWEKTGMIKVDIKSAEWNTYTDYARKGQMQVYLLGWYPDYLDPDDYTTPFLDGDANGWAGTGYNNTQMNTILRKAQTITDQNQRAKLYEQAQDILAQDVPYIPLIQGKLFVVTQKSVKGVTIGPDMIFHYSTVYKTG